MDKTNKKYNRKEYIDGVNSVTHFEFSLLPFDVQMAYVDTLYGYKVNEARANIKNGHVASGYGYIFDRYNPYFAMNGCTCENFDFGIKEHEIKCISPNKIYTVSEEAKEDLRWFIETMAEAKADVFESCVKRFYSAALSSIENGDSITFQIPPLQEIERAINHLGSLEDNGVLNDEEKRILMEAELSLVLERIKNGEIPTIVSLLSPSYQAVLNDLIEAENITKSEDYQLKLV